jgi:gephyrin
LVVEARKLSDTIQNSRNGCSEDTLIQDISKEDIDRVVQSLDAMGYDEAAQHVYGMSYPDWKKRHSKKASDEQMEKFNQSKPMWAKIDKPLLEKRTQDPGPKLRGAGGGKGTLTIANSTAAHTMSLLSNVCCQDAGETVALTTASSAITNTYPVDPTGNTLDASHSGPRQPLPYQAPALPNGDLSLSLGILTVSDRAFSGDYRTGDLSGPAVQNSVADVLNKNADTSRITLVSTVTAIVPDDSEAIQSKLKEWSDTDAIDVIFTTGGTGFSPRDVTPEATDMVLEKNCEGLLSFCTMECSRMQPLASLSRGVAGIRGKTFIANLPGNPKGVDEIMPVLLPLVLHAVADIQKVSG